MARHFSGYPEKPDVEQPHQGSTDNVVAVE
jgi:hypothetical protein